MPRRPQTKSVTCERCGDTYPLVEVDLTADGLICLPCIHERRRS